MNPEINIIDGNIVTGAGFQKEIAEDKARRAPAFQHKTVLRQILQAIETSKMDDELKMFLRLRIWGRDSQVFDPLSLVQIAEMTHVRMDIVEDWERNAKGHLREHLEKHSVLDIVENFEVDKVVKKLVDKFGVPFK